MFFNSTFTEATDTTLGSYTGELGGGYTLITAGVLMTVNGGGGYVGGLDQYASSLYRSTMVAPSADCKVTCVVRFTVTPEEGARFFFGGWTDAAGSNRLEVYMTGTAWSVRKVLAGVATVLYEGFSVPDINTDYTLELEKIGTTTTFKVDGSTRWTGTVADAAFSSPGSLLVGGRLYARVLSLTGATAVAPDTTAPTLTSALGTGGSETSSGGVTTNEANGTLFAVVTGSGTAPTALQVEAGQDHTGSSALRVVNQAVTATGAQVISSGTMTGGTRYFHYMHKDAANNRSSVLSSASFAVTVPDATAPTLSGPAATGGPLSCGASVSTNEGNGSLYVVFTASATAPTAAQVKLGQDHTGSAALRAVTQSVVTTGAQVVAGGAITAGTRYAHFMHEDAATNQSTVSSSASIVVTVSAPTINGQPTNQSVTVPGTGTFSVTATASSGALSYQWQRQPSGGNGYVNVVGGSGGTTASYTTGVTTVTGGSHNNGDTYRCVVTDANGSTTTSAATLLVTPLPAGFNLNSAAYAFKANDGAIAANTAIVFGIHNVSTQALVAVVTGLSTDANGIVTTKITHGSLVAGTLYSINVDNSNGSAYGRIKLTATA